MIIQTSRFGEVESKEQETIEFIHGFLGFDHLRKYILISVADSPCFYWLQSLEDGEVAFLIVNSFAFFPEYQFELPEHYRQELGIENQEDLNIFSTVTIPTGGVEEMTANLVAPVIINQRQRLAMQLVLQSVDYNTKHKLFQHQRLSKVAGE